ncbi:hypothetical protein KXQ82_05665 [Mucilaginibacter sp. HMF5004]|uniref:hypothetical protein n=1 Tax=Mucilaginibacter rivuli TaxID=2857527 RepID=UPI001C5D226A|nr:hypothetical protein [Mucilaginibacter rivuli]MBW4889190.1 hypothetical protein [Mucilaginibacter rivuli]
MKINDKQPTIIEFKKNEVKTLEHISTRATMFKELPSLFDKIQQAYYDNKALLTKTTGDFILHIDFEMEVQDAPHTVLLGANVTGNYSLCSYFLAITGKNDLKKELIRKFHFDYALPPAPGANIKQPSPIYHLQYGGKPTPEMGNLEITDNLMEHWLSLPRLNFSPVNIALLLDTLLCELRTDKTKKIIENPEWRSLVYKNEMFLSNHYFENIRSHINSGNYNNKCLVRDYCYGN